jgi:hypothetical protein
MVISREGLRTNNRQAVRVPGSARRGTDLARQARELLQPD